MTATVLRADARCLPLPDASVDLIVTSPPYFGLRSYTDNGEHYGGQIGSEATPREWLAAMLECTAEWMRVLKPSGSIFVNLGDKYSGAQAQNDGRPAARGDSADFWRRTDPKRTGIPNKSLMGLPWRYALACMDDLGLILRRDIIWAKPNSLPESVTDRCRSSHEYLFHLVKQPRYYAAVDSIREPLTVPRGLGPGAGRQSVVRGTTGNAPLRRPALGPELRAAVHAEDGPAVSRGWCLLGSLQEGIRAAMTGEAQGLQVLRPVGFLMRVETPERDYVVDLDAVSGPALDAASAVPLEDALAKLWPAGPAPRLTAASPVGILLADVDLDDTSGRAEVLDLECMPVAAEGLAARITLDLHPGRATLLVWASLGSSHDSILPQRNSPLGKLPGSVWGIPSQPLTVPAHLGVDHFAAFPMELPRRIILGWSPPGICVACGEGRRPVVDKAAVPHWKGGSIGTDALHGDVGGMKFGNGAARFNYETTVTGYACACPDATAPTRPALVADPFGGTGTTALVADMLGRTGVSFDLSADYCRLARWRVTDPAERARALGVPKPPPVPDGQGDLFAEVAP